MTSLNLDTPTFRPPSIFSYSTLTLTLLCESKGFFLNIKGLSKHQGYQIEQSLSTLVNKVRKTLLLLKEINQNLRYVTQENEDETLRI